MHRGLRRRPIGNTPQAPLLKRDTTPNKIKSGRNLIQDKLPGKNHDFQRGSWLPNPRDRLQGNTLRGTRSRQTTKKKRVGWLNRIPPVWSMGPGPKIPLSTRAGLDTTTSNSVRRSNSQTNKGLLHLRA